MLDLSNYRVVDLSPQVVAEVTTFDGKKLAGEPDPLGEMCWLKESILGEGTDHTKSRGVAMGSHTGSHTEGGMGHIDHWEDFDKSAMRGLWEYPLDAFYGEAAVCDLSTIKPMDEKEVAEGQRRGRPIKPEHLKNVKRNDIVLMWSSYKTHEEAPYIVAETAYWLVETGIKMLGAQMPGILFDTPESTTHKKLLAKNISITYSLENLNSLKRDRVYYIGLPIKIARMEASWIRAIAVEQM